MGNPTLRNLKIAVDEVYAPMYVSDNKASGRGCNRGYLWGFLQALVKAIGVYKKSMTLPGTPPVGSLSHGYPSRARHQRRGIVSTVYEEVSEISDK